MSIVRFNNSAGSRTSRVEGRESIPLSSMTKRIVVLHTVLRLPTFASPGISTRRCRATESVTSFARCEIRRVVTYVDRRAA